MRIYTIKYINKEEIVKATISGKSINIEDILDEFKNSKSDNPNYHNGYNKKTLK